MNLQRNTGKCHRQPPKHAAAAFLLIGLLLGPVGCNNTPVPMTPNKIKILTFGDSITRGTRDGVKENQTFTFYLGESLTKNGFTVEMIKKGISGEKTREALYRLDRDVIREKPHYVTIMYGTNDAFIDFQVDENDTTPRIPLENYRENLITMIKALKKNNIKVILMTPIPMGDFPGLTTGVYKIYGTNFKLKEYAAAVRDIAAAEKVLLVDHFNQWLKWKTEGKDINDWLTDGVHPNPKGHRVMAAAILKVIGADLKK